MSVKISISAVLDALLTILAMHARIALTIIAICNLLRLTVADDFTMQSLPISSHLNFVNNQPVQQSNWSQRLEQLPSLTASVIDHSHHHHSMEHVPMSVRPHMSEKHHVGDHFGDYVGDIEYLPEDELRFLYFRMHDSDGDQRLDGRELVDSLLHFHGEEGSEKVFGHEELANMIDPILLSDDKDGDGFIDYQEFVAAQKSRGF